MFLLRKKAESTSKKLTLRSHDGSVGLHVRETATRLSSCPSARQDLVHAAVLCLEVLDLHDILQAVDGATKVDLPYGGVRLVAVLARVDGPLAKQSRVSLLAVAALLCMNPRHAEDGLLRVYPLQPVEAARVDHSADPVPHPLRPLVVVRRSGNGGHG